MNTSRSLEGILKEIRDAYSEERRTDGALTFAPRGREPIVSADEIRWEIDELTVVWPSSPPRSARLRETNGRTVHQIEGVCRS